MGYPKQAAILPLLSDPHGEMELVAPLVRHVGRCGIATLVDGMHMSVVSYVHHHVGVPLESLQWGLEGLAARRRAMALGRIQALAVEVLDRLLKGAGTDLDVKELVLAAMRPHALIVQDLYALHSLLLNQRKTTGGPSVH